MPRMRRSEPWVKLCIEAIARLGAPQAAMMLHRVQHERMSMWRYAWPRDCRDTAHRALASLIEQLDSGGPN